MASTSISFAQFSKAADIPLATWELGNLTNIDNHIDPIITGQALSSDDLTEWKKRKERFRKCGLCGDIQAFPED